MGGARTVTALCKAPLAEPPQFATKNPRLHPFSRGQIIFNLLPTIYLCILALPWHELRSVLCQSPLHVEIARRFASGDTIVEILHFSVAAFRGMSADLTHSSI
jgi:hypothetical protein